MSPRLSEFHHDSESAPLVSELEYYFGAIPGYTTENIGRHNATERSFDETECL